MKPEKIPEIIFNLFAIVLGLAFIYVPFADFLESNDRRNSFSESEQADIRSIREKGDQLAITEAVNRLMSRPDIARVQVKIGEYEYPTFELTRGKIERGTEIGPTVYEIDKGFWLNIGYTRASVGAPSESEQVKSAIRSLGSAMGGCFLIVMVLLNLFGAFLKKEQKTVEKRPPSSPLPEDRTPAREPDPVRYDGLRVIKGK